MGCSTSNTSMEANERKRESNASANQDGSNKYPASEAFVIPLDQSVVLPIEQFNPSTQITPGTTKRMPKRLQQLMEQSATAASSEKPNNLDDLEDKLQKAEERRKEYLRQKIENIQKTTQMAMLTPQQTNDESEEAIHSKALDDDSKQELLDKTMIKES